MHSLFQVQQILVLRLFRWYLKNAPSYYKTACRPEMLGPNKFKVNIKEKVKQKKTFCQLVADKLLESLMFKYMFNHLRDNNLLFFLYNLALYPEILQYISLHFSTTQFVRHLTQVKKSGQCSVTSVKLSTECGTLDFYLFKLKSAGVAGSVLTWFESYLSDRRQRVVLPGANSNWTFIHAGVPQGSILGVLLFLLYINDIVPEIGSNIRLFADDTSLSIVVNGPLTAAGQLNIDLKKISQLATTWFISFNPTKTEAMLFSTLDLTIHLSSCKITR